MGITDNSAPPSTTAAPNYQYVDQDPYKQNPTYQQDLGQEQIQVNVTPMVGSYDVDINQLERTIFIRNVLLIVAGQLFLVAVMTGIIYAFEPMRNWVVESSYWTIWVAFIIEIMLLIPMFIFRKNPTLAAPLLIGFTLASGWMATIIVCLSELSVIIEAVAITAVIVVSCIGYCMYSKADFRWLYLVIVSISFMMFFWSLSFFMFWWIAPDAFMWSYQIYILLGIMLFVAYLLFDMSLICTRYETDEYLIAAVNLYLDILNIFIYILILLTGRK